MGICFGNEEKPTWDTTISFIPPITNGIVINVYDGDTITIAQKLPYDSSPMYRFFIRLKGLSTVRISTVR